MPNAFDVLAKGRQARRHLTAPTRPHRHAPASPGLLKTAGPSPRRPPSA
jgi:hypothetical protein